jgi:ribosomal protein S18 acetylase RimI-like enzyme
MSAGEISIRPARADDVESLRELSEQLGYPSSLNEARRRLAVILDQQQQALLVAETSDGTVVGWVHGILRPLLLEPPHIEIGGLVVKAGHRNAGIGEQLMHAIEDWACGMGAQEILIYSNVIRDRAYRFYERIGYEGFKQSRVFRKKI